MYRTMSGLLGLRDTLNTSYKKGKAQEEDMAKQGYVRNDKLSNGNQAIFYNPTENKMLMTVAGSHNASDFLTDVALAAGQLKSTARYKEANKVIKKARELYPGAETSIVGHSLGGSIAGLIASKSRGEKVTTLDKGATFGSRIRSNETAFRTAGDAVSLLNANSKRMTTLSNPQTKTGILPFDALRAHDIGNVKASKKIRFV